MIQKVTNTQRNVTQLEEIMGEPTGIQGTTRIDKIVKERMESWLLTNDAREQGFYSNADFVTRAVREALDKYMTPQEIPSHFILPNVKNHSLTLDFDVYQDRIICNMCSSETCIHIQKLKTDSSAKKYLKEHLDRKKNRDQAKSS